MPKSDNQKLKIFYILDYLERNSREDNPIRAGELIAMLDRDHNIACERKTVYSDSPLDVALGFRAAGAEYLHLVDLDGAKSGKTEPAPPQPESPGCQTAPIFAVTPRLPFRSGSKLGQSPFSAAGLPFSETGKSPEKPQT